MPIGNSISGHPTHSTGGGSGGAVSTVFGRAGDVVANTGDYTALQVGADPAGTAQALFDTVTGAFIGNRYAGVWDASLNYTGDPSIPNNALNDSSYLDSGSTYGVQSGANDFEFDGGKFAWVSSTAGTPINSKARTFKLVWPTFDAGVDTTYQYSLVVYSSNTSILDYYNMTQNSLVDSTKWMVALTLLNENFFGGTGISPILFGYENATRSILFQASPFNSPNNTQTLLANDEVYLTVNTTTGQVLGYINNDLIFDVNIDLSNFPTGETFVASIIVTYHTPFTQTNPIKFSYDMGFTGYQPFITNNIVGGNANLPSEIIDGQYVTVSAGGSYGTSTGDFVEFFDGLPSIITPSNSHIIKLIQDNAPSGGGSSLSPFPWDITTGVLPLNGTPGTMLEISTNGTYQNVEAVIGDIVLVNNDLSISNLTKNNFAGNSTVLASLNMSLIPPGINSAVLSNNNKTFTLTGAASLVTSDKNIDESYPYDDITFEFTLTNDAPSYTGSRVYYYGIVPEIFFTAANLTDPRVNIIAVSNGGTNLVVVNGSITPYATPLPVTGDIITITINKSTNTVSYYINGVNIYQTSTPASLHDAAGYRMLFGVQLSTYSPGTHGPFTLDFNAGQNPYAYSLPGFTHSYIKTQSNEFTGYLKVKSINWNPNDGYPSNPQPGDLYYASTSGTISGHDIIPGMGIWYDGAGWKFLDDAIHNTNIQIYAGEWATATSYPPYINGAFYKITVDMKITLATNIYRKIPKGSILVCTGGSSYKIFSYPELETNSYNFPEIRNMVVTTYPSTTVRSYPIDKTIVNSYDKFKVMSSRGQITQFGIGRTEPGISYTRGTFEVTINKVPTGTLSNHFIGLIASNSRAANLYNVFDASEAKSFNSAFYAYVSLNGVLHYGGDLGPGTITIAGGNLVATDRLTFFVSIPDDKVVVLKNGVLGASFLISAVSSTTDKVIGDPNFGLLLASSNGSNVAVQENIYHVNSGYNFIEYVYEPNSNTSSLETGEGVFTYLSDDGYMKFKNNVQVSPYTNINYTPDLLPYKQGAVVVKNNITTIFKIDNIYSDVFSENSTKSLTDYTFPFIADSNTSLIVTSVDYKQIGLYNFQAPTSHTMYFAIPYSDVNYSVTFGLNIFDSSFNFLTGLSESFITFTQYDDSGTPRFSLSTNNSYIPIANDPIAGRTVDINGNDVLVFSLTFAIWFEPLGGNQYGRYVSVVMTDLDYNITLLVDPNSAYNVINTDDSLYFLRYSWFLSYTNTQNNINRGIRIFTDEQEASSFVPSVSSTYFNDMNPGTNYATTLPSGSVFTRMTFYAPISYDYTANISATSVYTNLLPSLKTSLPEGGIFKVVEDATDGVNFYSQGDLGFYNAFSDQIFLFDLKRPNETFLLLDGGQYLKTRGQSSQVDERLAIIQEHHMNQSVLIEFISNRSLITQAYINTSLFYPLPYMDSNGADYGNFTINDKYLNAVSPYEARRWIIIEITNNYADADGVFFKLNLSESPDTAPVRSNYKLVNNTRLHPYIRKGETKKYKLYANAINQNLNLGTVMVEDITPNVVLDKHEKFELFRRTETITSTTDLVVYQPDKDFVVEKIRVFSTTFDGTVTLRGTDYNDNPINETVTINGSGTTVYIPTTDIVLSKDYVATFDVVANNTSSGLTVELIGY